MESLKELQRLLSHQVEDLQVADRDGHCHSEPPGILDLKTFMSLSAPPLAMCSWLDQSQHNTLSEWPGGDEMTDLQHLVQETESDITL